MTARERGSGPIREVSVIATRSESPGPTIAPAEPNTNNLGPAPVSEVGVFYRKAGEWVEMMPEVVNWKTGGVLKSVSTAFIVKEDVNGRLRGGQSRTALNEPIQLLVYAPEGTQVTEYQLIRLRMHTNAREFRTVTGGILHVSGDSNRDNLLFDSNHIAARTWTVPLNGLKAGEYGLLPPGALETRSASAQLGKMYTFTVVE